MTDTIEPFVINADDDQLADLKQRLSMTRWPDRETPDDWSQGIPLAYLKEVVEYWRDEYEWREREAALNRWNGFLTSIDGLDVHFLHAPSAEPAAKPLLLTHGWPGSIVEFQKVVGPLTDPVGHGADAADAFHVVCPTLPGFGFSGKPSEPGWGVEKIAGAWDDLMLRLGYERYFAQGGDWGAMVTTAIATQNRGHCAAIHVNMALVAPDRDTFDDLTNAEQSALDGMQFYQDHDSGYSKQQSTRPQTVGYGLADSPAGQAAWILEKFYQWTDCDGHPENAVGRDELLDNVMMYWLPNAAASSARIYWESFGRIRRSPVDLPTGISVFPKEIFRTSERWARKRFRNLVHFNTLDNGGHFAALEQPEVFVEEVRACFRQLR